MYDKFVNEYSCTDVKEKEFLLNKKGIKYKFVKVVDNVTIWKFIKTTELFTALAEYNSNK